MAALVLRTLQHDYLLVQLIDDDDATASTANGIVSPYGRHSETPRIALVLHAGPGYLLADGTRAPMCATVGDTVMLQLNAGTPIRVSGTVYHMVLDRDLFGVVA